MSGNLISFLKSKTFIFNLIAALILALFIILGVYKWLDSHTRHGESISVPDLRGMKLDRLDEFLGEQQLRYKVVDSLFELGKKPGTVLEQDPAPDSKVKENRTLYLTVNSSQPPKVKMPNLVDVSHRQAEAILQTFGLKVGRLIYKPDLAKNAVLEQLYKGSPIEPGKEVHKGSSIDLVLGDGLGNTEVNIPDLVGLTRGEALFVLKGSALNIGTARFDPGVRDSANATVYKQIPAADAGVTIRQGDAIDIYLR